jgi:hypothetical protein
MGAPRHCGLRPWRGEVIELLIDVTRNGKRGRQMAALSKIWDHVAQCFIRGHIILTALQRNLVVVLASDWHEK